MTVRTRFAPSPTGYLHVGGARTALFSWLYAKKHGGQFVLRIEDTDQERSTQASIDAILDGMKWLGLDYDEGPIYQSDRFEHYTNIANELIAQDKAYRCNCSKERLEQLRSQQLANKQKPRYDGHCRNKKLSEEQQPFVIRFKTPHEGSVSFNDLVHGTITIQNHELDDVILLRSDGVPTYNFTVVIDDSDMQITHAIRGDDHINNTPRQINIYHALNKTPPLYAHVPMILGDDGKRLSKRHGAVSVMQYSDEGFLPEALLNYLVRLGWSHGDQEFFSVQDMIELFDLDKIHKSAAAFDTEKLSWLNQHYMKTLPSDYVASHLQPHLNNVSINAKPALAKVVELQAEKFKTLTDMAEKSDYFYHDVTSYNEKSARKFFNADIIPVLEFVLKHLTTLEHWDKENIHNVIAETVEHFSLKFPKVAQPLRIAVTGDTISPSIDATLALIGQNSSLERIGRAIAYIQGTISPC